MQKIIGVALPVALNQLFSYYIETDENDLIGRRVLVPFVNKKMTGVIVEISDKSQYKLKSIIKIIDFAPIFNLKMIEFLQWISNYYLAPIGEVFKAAIPGSMSYENKQRIRLIGSITDDILEDLQRKAPKQAELIKILRESSGNLSLNHLKREMKGTSISSIIKKLELLELIAIDDGETNDKEEKKVKHIYLADKYFKDTNQLNSLVKSLEKKAVKQAIFINMFAMRFADNAPQAQTKICKIFNINPSIVNALIEKNIFICEMLPDSETDSNEYTLSTKKEITLSLTTEQDFIVRDWIERYEKGDLKPSLIHGITGSGKTLIYMHIIRYLIDKGKSTILMVPEISLTPQLIDRFNNAFSGMLSVIHSKTSLNEKIKSWADISSGKSKIVIGARSAIFSPCQNLGVIIADEEHDHSYKQDSPSPRYNARDAAIIRAKMESAGVILGSATPAIETMYNAVNGKYKLYEINNRADGAKLPNIVTIDMISATKSGQLYGSISKQLLQEMEDKILKKEGIIIFQNRRGFASLLQCQECGYIPECNQCSVNLTYHKSKNHLKCHYCGYTVYAIKSCPQCGSNNIIEHGSGTQKIEEEIQNYFDENNIKVNIQRMDLDTTSKKGSHRKILESFAKGETDILIGTQMVAKGLDFDRVTLVGIINADLQLFMPDFRASERTFQLITQVSGRAGRSADKRGEVYIQTSKPEHPSIVAARVNSYKTYYENELENRLSAFYPPFSRLILIEFQSEDQNLVSKHSELFSKIFEYDTNSNLVLGPTSPLIEKLQGNYRKIILIKNLKKIDSGGVNIRDSIQKAYNEYQKKHANPKVRIKIDIDSFSSL